MRYVRISPAIGIHYGVPLRLSLAAGGLFDFRGSHNDGVIAMGEMGQGGGAVSIGYFRSVARRAARRTEHGDSPPS